jgi:hypothetical protein
MRQFDQWTLEAIRLEGASMSWFEEQRYEWIPQIISAMDQIMLGRTIILVTDHERRWFAHYITETINKKLKERPLIPIVCLDALYPHMDKLNNIEGMDTLSDMLEISFKGEYFFWYVGRGGDERRADIIKRTDNALMWIMDEHYPNALTLKSYHSHIDIKLLQLYKLFDRTLASVLFGETDVHA